MHKLPRSLQPASNLWPDLSNRIFFSNSCSWLNWNNCGESTTVVGKLFQRLITPVKKVQLVSHVYFISFSLQSMHLTLPLPTALKSWDVIIRFCSLVRHFLTASQLLYFMAAQSRNLFKEFCCRLGALQIRPCRVIAVLSLI